MFKRKNRQHKNSEPKANNVITTAVETKESAPADAVPADAAPADTATADTATADTAPADTVAAATDTTSDTNTAPEVSPEDSAAQDSDAKESDAQDSSTKAKGKHKNNKSKAKTTAPAASEPESNEDNDAEAKDAETKVEADSKTQEDADTTELTAAKTEDSAEAETEAKPEDKPEAEAKAPVADQQEASAEPSESTSDASPVPTQTEQNLDSGSPSAAGDSDETALNTSRVSKQRLKTVVTADQEGEMAELEAQQKSAQAKEAQNKEQTGTTPSSELPRAKDDKPVNDVFKSKIIVITSGKGGVGKTTSAAAISTGLALQGHKTVVIDFDVGLRNLDLIMGCERRVVYDFINVIHGEARLNQALIKDKNCDNLFILPASQTKDKESLSYHGVGLVLKELSDMGFEYVICDSPAGIESGALIALYYADVAIVTTNPEISSVRDSDRIIGILNARSRRAVNNWDPIDTRLLLTRYEPSRVEKEEMLSRENIQELLNIPLLGVIPESKDVLNASNTGVSIIHDKKSDAGQAYADSVDRLLGKEIPLRFVDIKKTFWEKLFG